MRDWGFLVAILALGCHATRIFAAAEDLAGPEVGDENEVFSASADVAAREQCSSGYTWCASLVAVLTLAALVWATCGKPPDSRRDEHEARLLESQNQLRRAREEMKIAEKLKQNLVTEVVWWQGLHVDEQHEKRGLRKKLRQFREEIEPSLLGELDRKEKLVKMLDSRLDAIDHRCTTCFLPSRGGEVGSGGGNDGRGTNAGGNGGGGGGSDYSKEEGDGHGCGSRGRGSKRDRKNTEGGMGTGRSGHRSSRQVGHNYEKNFEQLVRSLSPLSAASAPMQREGRNDGGEARGRQDGSGVSTIEHIEQDGEETVTQHMRPPPPFGAARVHTEGEKLAVGEDAADCLGGADMPGIKTSEPNDAEFLRAIALPLPLSPDADVCTEGGTHGKGHTGGAPGVRAGPDSLRFLSASGTVSSCSPLTSLGGANVPQQMTVGQEEQKEEETKRPEPSTRVDGECADTGGATARDHNAWVRWFMLNVAGLKQPAVREGVEDDLAWAPPVNPKFTFSLPPQRKSHTSTNHAGSRKAAAVQLLAGGKRSTRGGHVGEPFSANTPLTPGTPGKGFRFKVGGVGESAVTAKESAETTAPVANVLAPPCLAGEGDGRAGEREPYVFGRTLAPGGARSEEQPSPFRFVFGRTGVSEALPVTEVPAPKDATAAFFKAMSTVSAMGDAGNGGGRGNAQTTFREGVKYVIKGRRVSSDEAGVYAMEARLRALQDKSERVAAVHHKNILQCSHPLLQPHRHDYDCEFEDGFDLDSDGEVKDDLGEEGKGDGGSDDGYGAQGGARPPFAGD